MYELLGKTLLPIKTAADSESITAELDVSQADAPVLLRMDLMNKE